jgi:hypothetical protein
MSMAGIMCDRFEDAVAKLVEEADRHLDGLNIADILQRAATKQLKACHGGNGDDRDQACFEILDRANRELVEDIPAARERLRQWYEGKSGHFRSRDGSGHTAIRVASSPNQG